MEVVPLGGKNVTDDIAYGLNISAVTAEKLKTLHGAAFSSIRDEQNVVFIPAAQGDDVINLQQIPKSSLNQIIQPRVEEILGMVKKKITASFFTNNFSPNVIITGGGSMLTGMRDFVDEILNKKAKIKKIEVAVKGVDIPIIDSFSVAIGMIKFAQLDNNRATKTKKSAPSDKNEGFFKKALAWIENNL
jgi:cell division protein FtsA